jgi:hypothetical protein
MRQGEFRSAFAGETQGGFRSEGPVDLMVIGRSLGRALNGALTAPLPPEWRALLSRLDDAGSRQRTHEGRMANSNIE